MAELTQRGLVFFFTSSSEDSSCQLLRLLGLGFRGAPESFGK